MSKIIEITPALERRVLETRRMSDREKIARLELDLEWANKKLEARDSRIMELEGAVIDLIASCRIVGIDDPAVQAAVATTIFRAEKAVHG